VAGGREGVGRRGGEGREAAEGGGAAESPSESEDSEGFGGRGGSPNPSRILRSVGLSPFIFLEYMQKSKNGSLTIG
jgi:hypothetical protein